MFHNPARASVAVHSPTEFIARVMQKGDGVSGLEVNHFLVEVLATVDTATKTCERQATGVSVTPVDASVLERGRLNSLHSVAHRVGPRARNAGDDVFVCGPGQLMQAHTVDDFMEM